MTPNYLIGIDCGVNTGICIWGKLEKKIIYIDTVKIHEALAAVKDFFDLHGKTIMVKVEDARLRKWIPFGKNEKAERGRREGAGSVKRDAIIWEDFLTDLDIPFELIAPKNNKTKVTAEYFKMLTRYEGKTNSHSRDAAMMVVGG